MSSFKKTTNLRGICAYASKRWIVRCRKRIRFKVDEKLLTVEIIFNKAVSDPTVATSCHREQPERFHKLFSPVKSFTIVERDMNNLKYILGDH